jgi:tRNA G18 (ribose-2'-O)-methylase SpoU
LIGWLAGAAVFVEMHGTFASMNVVTALSVALYEHRRQRPAQLVKDSTG